MKKISVIVLALALVFALTACSDSGEENKTLTEISLDTSSVKKNYEINESLNLSGLVVTAHYSDSPSQKVTGYTANPANGTTLTTEGTITVTVSYTEGDITKTDTFSISVGLGDGSENNPFQVNSVATLQKVGTGDADWTLDAHYIQTADIDLAEVDNWTPIGSEYLSSLIGSYDGGGYKIKNLTISATADNQGLFGFVEAPGVVKNVILIDCDITSTGSSVGGIVGSNYFGTVTNSYVTGNVSGDSSVGGVVGYLNGGSVTNSYATANVSGSGGAIGGVVGMSGGTVTNSYATGNVSGTDTVGGVVGGNYNGTVTNSYATGNVSISNEDSFRSSYVGGVVGSINGGTVTNSYATGNVSGYGGYVGGVVGYINGGSVTNSYATGNVLASGRSGGIIGDIIFATVQNCVALSGSIYRISNCPRIGNLSSGTLTNNYARSDMLVNGYTVSTNNTTSGTNGYDITSTNWSSESWWTDTALWDDEDWDFSGISETNLPILRNVGGTQNPTVQAIEEEE